MKENFAAVPATQTDELKYDLGRVGLVSIAVGQTIGAGIMAMTGIAIGMTGRSINIAFIIVGILCVFTTIPQILVGGITRFRGGQYIQITAFGGQRLADIFTVVNVFTGLGTVMYMTLFTECLLAPVPNAPAKLAAAVITTFMFGSNILGTKQAAVLQAVMCVVMIPVIGTSIVFGIPDSQPGYFVPPDFMTKGFTGMLIASVYLSFAAGGTQYVINLSGEAENPKKDVPFAIIVPTVGISLIYAIMRTIAASTLPMVKVANKSLALVAEAIMPRPVYVFSIVSGAIFALLTTLNASISWICRPVVQAVKDDWLPGFFGKVNGKFGIPINVLLLLYAIGLVPTSIGLSINTISNATIILTAVMKAIPCFTALRLPSVMPELWNKSKSHISRRLLNTFCMIDELITTFQVVLLLIALAKVEIIGNVIILTVAVIYALAVNSKAKMEVGYKDYD